MNNLGQMLSDEQKQLAENEFKYAPNPELLPSPYLWSNTYTSPAWNSGQSGSGGGSLNPHSNMFNSALTQPLGLPQQHIGGQTGGMWGPTQNTELPLPMHLQRREDFWKRVSKEPKQYKGVMNGSGKRRRRGKKAQKGGEFTSQEELPQFRRAIIGATVGTPESIAKNRQRLKERRKYSAMN